MSTSHATLPPLPNPYRPLMAPPGSSALDHALAHAEQGVLAWVPGEFWAEAAVVLAPETPAEAALARQAGANALADALATIAPADLPLGFAWPGTLTLNHGRCGSIEARPGPNGLLLLGFRARLRFPPGHEAGLLPGETALVEEGAEEATAPHLAHAWALHLMAVLDAWEARGLPHLVEHYLARLLEPAAEPGLKRGIHPQTGALVLERGSCPEAWCRSCAPWRAGPPGQAATAGRLTVGLSLTAPMVSSVM